MCLKSICGLMYDVFQRRHSDYNEMTEVGEKVCVALSTKTLKSDTREVMKNQITFNKEIAKGLDYKIFRHKDKIIWK